MRDAQKDSAGKPFEPLCCFKCGKAMEQDTIVEPNEPLGGLEFISGGYEGHLGHYDPDVDYGNLILVVCDECLQKGSKQGTVALIEPLPEELRPPRTLRRYWRSR